MRFLSLVPALVYMATVIPVPEPEFGPSDLQEGVTLNIPNTVYPIESTAISSNIGFPIVPHPLLPNQTALKVVYQNETGPCTYSNTVVRREWSSLLRLMCPRLSRTTPTLPFCTSTMLLFPFQRQFLVLAPTPRWLFEQALHGCGFPKELGVPYMHWPLYGEYGIENSDESETSLGGNGWPDLTRDGNDRRVPHGSGGGCVMRSPFHDMVLNFQSLYDIYAISGLPGLFNAAWIVILINGYCVISSIRIFMMELLPSLISPPSRIFRTILSPPLLFMWVDTRLLA